MTAKRSLRPVQPDERAEPAKVMTLLESLEGGGTVRDQAAALRLRIAKKIEDPTCPTRDLASLSKRVIELTTIIEQWDAAHKHDDESTPAADERYDSTAV